jgi:hypothetical protein
MKNAMRSELLRIEEDLLWSEKANFQLCSIWSSLYWFLGVPSALLAALTGLSATEVLLADWTGYLGLGTTVFTTLATVINPTKRSQHAHQSGVGYSDLRSRVRRFRELRLEFSEDYKFFDEVEAFGREKSELQRQSPHTGGLPYWLAKRSIEYQRTHIHKVDQ